MTDKMLLVLRLADGRDGYEVVYGEEVMEFVPFTEVVFWERPAADAVERAKRRIRVRRFAAALGSP